MIYRLYFIFTLGLIGSVAAAPEGCGLNLLRLPDRIVPYNYDIIMKPDMDALSFEGAVQISLRVVDLDPPLKNKESNERLAANQIVLHADESLKIDNVWYLNLGSKQSKSKEDYIEVVNICRDQKYQLLVITLAKNLESGTSGQLHLTFSGLLGESEHGFYKTAYTKTNINDNKTIIRYQAATQFQPTDARLAFPCFDEPALKATFDLTLVYPADRSALANTNPIYEGAFASSSSIKDFKKGSIESFLQSSSSSTGGDMKLVRFATTPLMSTYLLAFTVGEFDYVEREVLRNKGDKLRVRAYTPIGHSEEAKFALDTACRAIPIMEDYFQSEFPLNKLDFVHIPGYTASGAMENWGLVTFKGLLVNANSSPDTVARVARTVVHEIAHHWFGNLVTMKWWNALWLNEGLTSWMEYKITEQIYPQFQLQYHYLLDSHVQALSDDSYSATHPVQPPEKAIEEPSVIDYVFDSISYNKGAAIVRILEENIVKPELFKLAIRKYINSNKYGNTIATNLIDSIQSIKSGSSDGDNIDVRQFLRAWLPQAGHPIIKVDLFTRNDGNYELSLMQRRFVSNANGLTQAELKQHWLIPVSIVISDGQRHEVIEATMNYVNPTTVRLPDWFNPKRPGHWLKLNANFSGFYRVLYPVELLRLMEVPIEKQLMSPTDRLNLLDESSNLRSAKMMSSEHLFYVLTWFSHEDHGAVQVALAGAYNELLRTFEHEQSVRRKLELFGHRLFGHHHAKVSQEQQQYTDKLGQSVVLSTLININHEPTIAEALRVFGEEDIERPNNVAVHLRESVYAAVAKRGSDSQFERLFTLFKLTDSQEERFRLVNAMARATKTSRLKKVWLWLKGIDNNNTGLELLEHKIFVLRNMLVSQEGREFVKQLLKNHYTELVKLNNGKPMTSLIKELCVSMGVRQFEEMSQLFSHHKEVKDWPRIEKVVKGKFEWQSSILANGATERMEMALDNYLANESSENEINVA